MSEKNLAIVNFVLPKLVLAQVEKTSQLEPAKRPATPTSEPKLPPTNVLTVPTNPSPTPATPASKTAPAPIRPTPQTTIIKNVRVFDGTKVLNRSTVVLENGRIAAITPLPPTRFKGAKIIDGAGKTLLPGFVDGHIHSFPSTPEELPMFGVTTGWDVFTMPETAEQIKKNNSPYRADMLMSNASISGPGGHGEQYGFYFPTLDKKEDAKRLVQERAARGANYIKLMVTGGNLPPGGMEEVIKEAHAAGLKVFAHALTHDDAYKAVAAGADVLAHSFTDRIPSPALLRLLKKKNVLVVPTLGALEATCGVATGKSLTTDPHLKPYLTEAMDGALSMTMPPVPGAPTECIDQKAAMQAYVRAGVPLVASSNGYDYGTYPGINIHRELELMVLAGMTPLQALKSATSWPGDWMHKGKVGYIRKGAAADLVLVDGNPFANIKKTRAIVKVFKNGLEIPRETLRQKVLDEKALAETAKKIPAPKNSESGEVSNFENADYRKTIFGFGLTPATDVHLGGKSTATLEVVPGGANGSKYSLLVKGEVKIGASLASAGVSFFPGDVPMKPANLSGKKAITFWAKGDPSKRYMVLFSSTNRPFVRESIAMTGEWQKFSVPFEKLDKFQGYNTLFMSITCGAAPGPFQFQIDDVKFE